MGMESFLNSVKSNSIKFNGHQDKGSHIVPPSLQARDRLLPAIVSSCAMRGPSYVIKAIPESARFIEYYACMHPDLDIFFAESPKPKSALRVFAENAEGPGAEMKAEIFAKGLLKEFWGREIVAFASFIPEIMPPGELSKQSAAALRFLVMTADKLRKGDYPFVVEFVGGSRTQGLACHHRMIDDKEYTEYRVGILPSSKVQASIKELVGRLEPVAVEALKRHNIQLALQLEPGPFFLVNNAHTLDLFCKELDSNISQPWKKVIGLNLDIAHWAFASQHPTPESPPLTIGWLEENKHVLNRIVHAHISDQSIGHLCDLHLGAVHKEPEFAPWLQLIARRAAEEPDPDRGVLPFSGFIGIEHEACKSREHVIHSFDTLTKWLSTSADNLKVP